MACSAVQCTWACLPLHMSQCKQCLPLQCCPSIFGRLSTSIPSITTQVRAGGPLEPRLPCWRRRRASLAGRRRRLAGFLRAARRRRRQRRRSGRLAEWRRRLWHRLQLAAEQRRRRRPGCWRQARRRCRPGDGAAAVAKAQVCGELVLDGRSMLLKFPRVHLLAMYLSCNNICSGTIVTILKCGVN